MSLAPQSGLHLVLEPLIEHVVQIYVSQERTDRLSLARTCFAQEKPALFNDASLYPLQYQANHASIADSLLDHFHELFPHDGIKVRGNINFQDPSCGPSADDPLHFVQRLVLPSSGSEPVRAVVKALLINGVRYSYYGLLRDLSLPSGKHAWS